ncbi:hypothetical protein UAY_00970 [Enterococcus moraviensis ATCC BAA-383]|uniref:Uncharacterized protein n=1 Tax=Enterococcus moraviensis ATCC BAA-383 TaxID=1158609 RepID=R2T5G7_9ENTE|nr:hypothetical protein [Enterococcus moraviensis]EOI02723.1 hypothetical protein UAY_00970 [Enterococcus moraviensis ATCC BAA-383]EOT73900.1 hypothetical protein I586_00896 [Enterococcus moraviensis ATCC BAA-383]
MSVLDWVFIIGIALSIVALLGSGYFIVQVFHSRSLLKKLPKKKFKNKKKNRKIARKKQQLMKKKKKSVRLFLMLSFVTVALAGGMSYLSYYQSMNLTTGDSDSVVKGYYLLRDFEDQLIIARDKSDDEEKLQKNIRYLATSMASYGTKKASDINSEEGQITLNRYYNSIKQLGMNASTQTKNFFGNQELVDSFLADIKKAQVYEKETFDYYKVNESAFKEEK